MKKSKFVKSTIILIIGGFLTKLLGMIIKIITTRFLGTEGIGIYMLLMPTFSLFIAISQLGFPVAISKLVAEETKNNKNLVFSIIPYVIRFFAKRFRLKITPIAYRYFIFNNIVYFC